MNSLPFSAIMPQANLEAAAIATVSFTRTSLRGDCWGCGDDFAPSVIEAAASESAPMGDQMEQMADAVVTNEAEQPERLKRPAGQAAAADSDT